MSASFNPGGSESSSTNKGVPGDILGAACGTSIRDDEGGRRRKGRGMKARDTARRFEQRYQTSAMSRQQPLGNSATAGSARLGHKAPPGGADHPERGFDEYSVASSARYSRRCHSKRVSEARRGRLVRALRIVKSVDEEEVDSCDDHESAGTTSSSSSSPRKSDLLISRAARRDPSVTNL
ncbi:unnamed protein product [Lampetra planeri]